MSTGKDRLRGIYNASSGSRLLSVAHDSVATARQPLASADTSPSYLSSARDAENELLSLYRQPSSVPLSSAKDAVVSCPGLIVLKAAADTQIVDGRRRRNLSSTTTRCRSTYILARLEAQLSSYDFF